MNTKNLSLNDLGIVDDVRFINDYHKYLLKHCMNYELHYDGLVAVEIMKLNHELERILEDPDKTLSSQDIQLLIKIAEGRIFKKTTELSDEYNRLNTHDILKTPRYNMFNVFVTHGY